LTNGSKCPSASSPEKRFKRGDFEMENTYNGYANYETWNVALIISNTKWIYYSAREFMKEFEGRNPYIAFTNYLGYESEVTDDGVKYLGHELDYQELDEFMTDYFKDE
jgi:hypothetical protein